MEVIYGDRANDWQKQVLEWLSVAADPFDHTHLKVVVENEADPDCPAIVLDNWLWIERTEVEVATILETKMLPGYHLCAWKELGGGYWEPPDGDLYPVEGTETQNPATIAMEALIHWARNWMEGAVQSHGEMKYVEEQKLWEEQMALGAENNERGYQ